MNTTRAATGPAARPDRVRDLADRDDVEALVRAFYRQVAMDDLLGPIFEAERVDWPTHIDTLTAFWSWQLLGERGYDGNPLRAHQPVHARRPFTRAHFDRWLELFLGVVEQDWAGPVADAAAQRAAKMAAAMERLLTTPQVAGIGETAGPQAVR